MGLNGIKQITINNLNIGDYVISFSVNDLTYSVNSYTQNILKTKKSIYVEFEGIGYKLLGTDLVIIQIMKGAKWWQKKTL